MARRMKKVLAVLIVVSVVVTCLMALPLAADGPDGKDKSGRGGGPLGDELNPMEDFRKGEGIVVAGIAAVPEELGITQLTFEDEKCMQPMFSPDGTRIAYMVDYPNHDGHRACEIWVMELRFSGGDVTVVDDYPVTDEDVQCANLEGWSPDGEKLLFRSGGRYIYPRDNSLWIVDADGEGTPEMLYDGGPDKACFGGPTLFQTSFIPDGNQIVFSLAYTDVGDRQSDIYVMDADGSDVTQLTDTEDYCEKTPRWSPDGEQILYKICDQDSMSDIWVMDADGDNQELVVEEVKANFFGWSPDGEWIVYEYKNEDSPSGNDRDIYKVRPNGSGNTRLTPSDDYCEHTPLWGPDGTIMYRSDELEQKGETDFSSTWVMNPNGSDKTMINPWGGKWHDWSPSGEWIVFQTCEPDSADGDGQIFIMRSAMAEGVSFSCSVMFGDAPLTVQFYNQTGGAPRWDFGDGSTSSAQNPTHTYLNEGIYTVTLTTLGRSVSQKITVESMVVPAELVVRNLRITPNELYPNQAVTIDADVYNQGGTWGSQDVGLMVNGEFEQRTGVGVSPGTAQPVRFTIYRANPGQYIVTIGEATGWFNVLSAPQLTAAPPPSPQPVAGGELGTGGIIAIVVIGIIVIAGIVVAVMLTRPR